MHKSQHVILTPVCEDDLPLLFEWINNREQVLFNAPYKPVHEIQHQQWFISIIQRNDVAIFGIRSQDTQTLIGTCQLHSINLIHRNAELQIRIGRIQERNKGYGSEAVDLLLKYAFRDLNLHRVYLHVFANNTAAIRAYEKNGFTQEGMERQAAFIDGEFRDVIEMAILRNEYDKR